MNALYQTGACLKLIILMQILNMVMIIKTKKMPLSLSLFSVFS